MTLEDGHPMITIGSNRKASYELSVFRPSETESQINKMRLFDAVSLSFKTRCSIAEMLSKFQAWTQRP